MFNLLYVHPRHPLTPQITFYYRLCGMERSPWPIDAVARLVCLYYEETSSLTVVNFLQCQCFLLSGCFSAGMNGFLWLTKRNGLKNLIHSPVYGLEDITNNQAL